MSAPFRPLATAIEQRRADVARVEDMAGAVMRVMGFVEVAGAGEVTVPVNFPVRFIERPSFSFGAEMAENEQIVAGKFPTCSGVVLKWNFGIRQDSGAKFYDGATLVIVVTGVPTQKMIFHYQMEGRALKNPLNGMGLVGGSI